MRPPTRERKWLNFAVYTLQQRWEMLGLVGPATEHPDEAREQQEALAFAMELLNRPRYEVGPFE